MSLNSLLVDFNSYFASCEQQDRPELRGRPVGVVPMLADSTCLIAASAEAKKLGVKVIGPHEREKPVLDNIPNRALVFGMPDAKGVTPDQWLREGDEVSVGGLSFSVIEAPGHSPGSVVFFNAANKFALMGDVLFQNSIGRTDIPGGNHETLLHSIKTKILALPDDVMFLPGHGNASQIGAERRSNPYLK